MKRSTRAELAKETVQITSLGWYEGARGGRVDISGDVEACLAGTRLFAADAVMQIRAEELARKSRGLSTAIDVVNETTLVGASRLVSSGGSVGVLNFASAKNPGGGFLNGSQAQEESLARSSALHASQLRSPSFYENHRASPSMLYSDAMIVSPDCVVFRDDEGALLTEPYRVTFITSPAPNAGAAAKSRPDEVPLARETLMRRAEGVLGLAARHGCERLVLGAWGCGVFGNDPAMVADVFAHHLLGAWDGRFAVVRFSVLDGSSSQETVGAFRRAFSTVGSPTARPIAQPTARPPIR